MARNPARAASSGAARLTITNNTTLGIAATLAVLYTQCQAKVKRPVGAPIAEAITSSLPREKQGVASALNDITREFGTALGVALLGALLASGYRSAIDDRLGGIPQGAAETARQGVANAIEAAGAAGSHAQALVDAARQSFVDGWQQAMWAGVVVMGVLFVHAAVRGPQNTLSASAKEETPDQVTA